MINADKVLADLHARNRRTLTAIFGDKYSEMGKEAKEAAEQVLMWVEGLSDRHDEAIETIRKRGETIKAINDVVREYAGDALFDSVKRNCTKREASDLRSMMYRMVYELTTIPKSNIAKELGTRQDHSTVHAALRRADDLHLMDKAFRETYDMLLARVRAKIDEAEQGI